MFRCCTHLRVAGAGKSRPSKAVDVGPAAPGRAPAAALLVATGLLGLAGCAKAPQPAAFAWAQVNEASLHAARERWAAARIEVYDYLPYCQVWSGGALLGQQQPQVTVRQGRVTGANASAPPGFLDHTEPLSMEGIFAVLEHTAADRSLNALFDRDTGVPLAICDPDKQAPGRWQYCAVGSFHVPQRNARNPERLRWPQPAVQGACLYSSAPDSP